MMQKETSHHNSQMGKRQSHQTGLVTEVAQSVKYSVPTDRQHPLNIYSLPWALLSLYS